VPATAASTPIVERMLIQKTYPLRMPANPTKPQIAVPTSATTKTINVDRAPSRLPGRLADNVRNAANIGSEIEPSREIQDALSQKPEGVFFTADCMLDFFFAERFNLPRAVSAVESGSALSSIGIKNSGLYQGREILTMRPALR
jgi:hypothetical protein